MRETGGPALPPHDPGPGSPGLVVGVDGGGTGSRALIMDWEGTPVAKAEGPPALIHPTDPGSAAQAIATTVSRAAEEVGEIVKEHADQVKEDIEEAVSN